MSASPFSAEQVAALAPDVASARAGQGLATPRKWVSLGRGGPAVWGECQGSGATPYQVIVDVREPAFRCSCPSRKFPCKHALAVLFLLAAQPDAVREGAAPAWVEEWLAGRTSRAERKAEKAAAPPAAPKPVDPEAQARRAAQREERVQAGLDDLQQWLFDLVRQGLAAAPGKPAAYWEGVAARLVDAQAPGAARRVRELARIPGSGDGWPERLLERLARLHLLAEAYRRLDALPEPVREDVRSTVGWANRQEEVLAAGEAVRDRWAVLGQVMEAEDALRVRRSWLRGEATGRTALLLAFAAGSQPLEPGPALGTVQDLDLVFYPGAFPLRALVRERHAAPEPLSTLAGFAVHDSLDDVAAAWAGALAANPWVERLAVALRAVVPVRSGDGWRLRDTDGRTLPLAPGAGEAGWVLLALGGGTPVELAAEWDGDTLLPLGARAGGRFVSFTLRDAPGGGTE